jgi:hypothetical protein
MHVLCVSEFVRNFRVICKWSVSGRTLCMYFVYQSLFEISRAVRDLVVPGYYKRLSLRVTFVIFD